jgi:hypothetical protein
MQDFDLHDFELKSHPLVILNTGISSPFFAAEWATSLLKHGARGVLTSECPIPDRFAASFIQKLYEYLLSGETIGEALITTRHYFWESRRVPYGLAYALYSSPSIRINR